MTFFFTHYYIIVIILNLILCVSATNLNGIQLGRAILTHIICLQHKFRGYFFFGVKRRISIITNIYLLILLVLIKLVVIGYRILINIGSIFIWDILLIHVWKIVRRLLLLSFWKIVGHIVILTYVVILWRTIKVVEVLMILYCFLL